MTKRFKDRSALASSLQTAYNLRVLPDLVQNLVVGLSDSIDERIKYAFDTVRISREMVGKGMHLADVYNFVSDVTNRTVIGRELALQIKG